ncbi:MAG: hypothetical protein D6753_11950 [Planctomycetota bacterium]|nr:MAG: hypothetical protein D6753_11950 [Planctomycetota bacterium]
MQPSMNQPLAAARREYEELVEAFRMTLGEHAIAATEMVAHVRARACRLAARFPHESSLQDLHAETMRWLDALDQRMTSSSEGW